MVHEIAGASNKADYLETDKRCLVLAADARLLSRGGVGVAAFRPLPLPLRPAALCCVLPRACIRQQSSCILEVHLNTIPDSHCMAVLHIWMLDSCAASCRKG